MAAAAEAALRSPASHTADSGQMKRHMQGQYQDLEQERLSQDLSLFLSNPTLRSALADGSLDLASYSSTVEAELAELEEACIGTYRSNTSRLSGLRTEMDECDAVLAGLQELLLGFQADLSGLSGEIKSLQDQSLTLSLQLGNRRDAELGLRAFLERIVVPPNLADVVCTGAVDETFVDCVRDLEESTRTCTWGSRTTRRSSSAWSVSAQGSPRRLPRRGRRSRST